MWDAETTPHDREIQFHGGRLGKILTKIGGGRRSGSRGSSYFGGHRGGSSSGRSSPGGRKSSTSNGDIKGSREGGSRRGRRHGTRHGGAYGAGAGRHSGHGLPCIAPIALLPFLVPHERLESLPMPGTSEGLSSGAIAGIIIGAIFGAGLLILILMSIGRCCEDKQPRDVEAQYPVRNSAVYPDLAQQDSEQGYNLAEYAPPSFPPPSSVLYKPPDYPPPHRAEFQPPDHPPPGRESLPTSGDQNGIKPQLSGNSIERTAPILYRQQSTDNSLEPKQQPKADAAALNRVDEDEAANLPTSENIDAENGAPRDANRVIEPHCSENSEEPREDELEQETRENQANATREGDDVVIRAEDSEQNADAGAVPECSEETAGREVLTATGQQAEHAPGNPTNGQLAGTENSEEEPGVELPAYTA